jgi:hypothetical protein
VGAVTTAAPVRESEREPVGTVAAGGPAEGPAGAPASPAAAPGPPAGAAGATPESATGEAYVPGASLLSPPDYDNIVGGVPPSPYASLMLLGGLICLLLAAVEAALGPGSMGLPPLDVGELTGGAEWLLSQWAVLGALLIVGAVFLAGFVSRS